MVMDGMEDVFTLWTATDSDGDGVLEYTEYFSATIETGALGTAYIPGLDDVFGCMDPAAENYNPSATVDDGSCTYGCDENEYVVTVDGGSWQAEVSWEIVDAAGAVVLAGGAPITVDDNVTACLANSGTNGYTLNMYDSYGDGWNGNVFTLWTAADSDGDGVLEYTEYFSATIEMEHPQQHTYQDWMMYLDVQILLHLIMMRLLQLTMVPVSHL